MTQSFVAALKSDRPMHAPGPGEGGRRPSPRRRSILRAPRHPLSPPSCFVLAVATLLLILLGDLPPSPTADALSDSNDLAAINGLRSAWYDDNAAALESWIVDTDPCGWLGVVCDAGAASIIALSLPSVGVAGTLPPELFQLTALQLLDLSGTSLSGSLPTMLGALSALTAADLSGCRFNESLPAALADLPSLVRFDAHNNSFTGRLPNVTFSLLTNLDVRDNLLAGPLPPQLFSGEFGAPSLNVANNAWLCDPVPTLPSGAASDFSGACGVEAEDPYDLHDLRYDEPCFPPPTHRDKGFAVLPSELSSLLSPTDSIMHIRTYHGGIAKEGDSLVLRPPA